MSKCEKGSNTCISEKKSCTFAHFYKMRYEEKYQSFVADHAGSLHEPDWLC